MKHISGLSKTTYIFDLFHTLTGPENNWSSLPTTSKFLGIDTELWNQMLFHGTYERLCGIIKDGDKIIRDIVDKIDPLLPDDKINDAVKLRKERFGHALRNIPQENIETLYGLKRAGKKIGLLSNADVLEISFWSESPLAGLFDTEIFSCHVGCAKPDLAIFEKALSALCSRPEESVFIGDGGSDELKGAREAGLETVLMTGIIRELWPEKIPQKRLYADYEIESLGELTKSLE